MLCFEEVPERRRRREGTKEQRGDVEEGEGEALRNEDRRASRRSAGKPT